MPSPLRSEAERQALLGPLEYVVEPDGKTVRIRGDWIRRYIVRVEVPQLARIPGIQHRGALVGQGPARGAVACHHLVADPLQVLWQAWDEAGLLPLVLTWGALWCPRLMRGGSGLSMPAFAAAFDINAPWNALGRAPAAEGKRGSVSPLAPIAEAQGWAWGGRFARTDGMHFEVTSGAIWAPEDIYG